MLKALSEKGVISVWWWCFIYLNKSANGWLNESSSYPSALGSERHQVSPYGGAVGSSRMGGSGWQGMLRLAQLLGLDKNLRCEMAPCYSQRIIQIDSAQQQPIRPLRGLPQGCPLPVALCSLWGALWAAQWAMRMDSQLNVVQQDNLFKTGRVYLDEVSSLVSEVHIFLQAACFTSLFVREWEITMSADNRHWSSTLRLRRGMICCYLSTIVGAFPRDAVIVRRCQKTFCGH